MSGKPPCVFSIIPRIVLELYGLRVKVIRQLASYDDRNILVQIEDNNSKNKDDECNTQPYYSVSDVIKPSQFLVVKILNGDDSAYPARIDAKNAIIVFLTKAGYPTPDLILDLKGGYQTLVELTDPDTDRTGKYILRVFEFGPGKSLDKVCLTRKHCQEIGVMAGWLDAVLKDFPSQDYPEVFNMKLHWNLSEMPYLRSKLHYLKDDTKLALIKDAITNFETNVLQSDAKLSTGIIHHDINDCNLLVDHSLNTTDSSCTKGDDSKGNTKCNSCVEGAYPITGVIDFGDMTFGPYLLELAIAMAYVMMNTEGIDPVEGAALVLQGYQEKHHLSFNELEHLRVSICARLVQSFVYGEVARIEDGGNEYAQSHSVRVWPMLEFLWKFPNDQFLQQLRDLSVKFQSTSSP